MTIGNANFQSKIQTKKLTDWEKFSKNLEQNYGDVPVIVSARQIEDEVKRLEQHINDALKLATKNLVLKRNKPNVPREILNLIRQKRQARRRANHTQHPDDKRNFNRLTDLVRKALIDLRNQQWERKIESFSTDNDSNHLNLWKMTRSLRKKQPIARVLHAQTGLVYSDCDKAEAFADYMETVCTPNLTNVDIDHMEKVERQTRRIRVDNNDDQIEPTSPSEIKDIINALKNRKAPGPDNIPNVALKKLPTKLIVVMVTICNAIFRFQHFPKQWKSANVIFIPKPSKDHSFPQNYRPISLISSVGKIVERLIRVRLMREVDKLKLLPDEQFGFRPKHSTIHQLSRLTEYVTNAFNKKQFAGAIFLDVSKAFDTVWHEGLLYKLLNAGMSKQMVRLIKSFLKQRSIRAKIGDVLSLPRDLGAGVPQGSVLSPLLYILFTYDMPKPTKSTLAIYADDTAIISSSLSTRLLTNYLQSAASQLEDWFKLWGVGVNPDKSTAILFTRKRRQPDNAVHMFDNDIPWRNEAKYLGILFDKRLSFIKQVNDAVSKGKRAFGMLYPLCGFSSNLSTENKLLLYKTIIRPTMTYASPVWGHMSKTSLLKLQRVQNKAIRAAFNAPWFVTNNQLHREAAIPTMQDFIRELAVKFYGNATVHPNPLIREATDYDEEDLSVIKRPKTILLW